MPNTLITTSTLRYITPRNEIRRLDRRPGAYPTVARTGDGKRSGKNVRWFDDRRTVLFLTATSIAYPITLSTGSFHLQQEVSGSNLSSSLVTTNEYVVGNVNKFAIEQFLSTNDQVETPGPFVDSKLFEQDEINLVNSQLMTGSAFFVAPDRFKSKIANKTIIRIPISLTTPSVLSPKSSSMHYLNPTSGGFDLVINQNGDFDKNILSNNWGDSIGETDPTFLDPVLFTPYGMQYSHPNTSKRYAFTNIIGDRDMNIFDQVSAARFLRGIDNYAYDGADVFPTSEKLDYTTDVRFSLFTASLISPNHAANSSQSIVLSNYLRHPFLLEKATLEMPVAAGPGWMNDAFSTRVIYARHPFVTVRPITWNFSVDMGGPLVTAALLRQNKVNNNRDLIASATFTNQLDATTASWIVISSSIIGNTVDVAILRTGLSGTVNVNKYIRGPVLSGSTNFFTGTITLDMTPSVLQHVMRYDISGSSILNIGIQNSGSDGGPNRHVGALATFGPMFRQYGQLQSGRSIFGRHMSMLSRADVDGTVPATYVKRYESDYDGLTNWEPSFNGAGHALGRWKMYQDVVSKSTYSPYLLYPEDSLILCLNKHRSVGNAFNLGSGSTFLRQVTGTVAQHDIQITTGTLYLTLYGDLISQDTEFHDTLNQRLETNEVHEEIGFDPVLDQFDVSYASDMSGSYVDRFTVISAVPYMAGILTSTLVSSRLFSNFTSHPTSDAANWSTEFLWTKQHFGYELKKSMKNRSFYSTNELFWDCRLPQINNLLKTINPQFKLVDNAGPLIIRHGSGYTLFTNTDGVGAREWQMAYPYEPRFGDLPCTFDLKNGRDAFETIDIGYGTFATVTKTVAYDQFVVAYDPLPNTSNVTFFAESLVNLVGMTTPELVKAFYGIGDAYSQTCNQKCYGRHAVVGEYALPVGVDGWCGVDIRGWKYGMYAGFPTRTSAVFRRDRFGQPRDMLEQRLYTKIYDDVGIDPTGNVNGSVGTRKSPVQVTFVDSTGAVTDPLRTLSSNVSIEATSSLPYCDGIARNRPAYDRTLLNIATSLI